MGDRRIDIHREPLRWLRIGAGFVAVALLVSVSITGALLTWRYQPDRGWPGVVPASARWSHRLVRRHQVGLLLAMPSVVLWGGLTIQASWERLRCKPRRRAAMVAGLVVAVLLTFTTAFAWRLVKWEQIAMWAVTVGTDIRGLWHAGFSDDVRFVLVRGVEVSRGTVGFWVVVHLVAPFLALAAIAGAWAAGRVPPSARPVTSPLPTLPPPPPG